MGTRTPVTQQVDQLSIQLHQLLFGNTTAHIPYPLNAPAYTGIPGPLPHNSPNVPTAQAHLPPVWMTPSTALHSPAAVMPTVTTAETQTSIRSILPEAQSVDSKDVSRPAAHERSRSISATPHSISLSSGYLYSRSAPAERTRSQESLRLERYEVSEGPRRLREEKAIVQGASSQGDGSVPGAPTEEHEDNERTKTPTGKHWEARSAQGTADIGGNTTAAFNYQKFKSHLEDVNAFGGPRGGVLLTHHQPRKARRPNRRHVSTHAVAFPERKNV